MEVTNKGQTDQSYANKLLDFEIAQITQKKSQDKSEQSLFERIETVTLEECQGGLRRYLIPVLRAESNCYLLILRNLNKQSLKTLDGQTPIDFKDYFTKRVIEIKKDFPDTKFKDLFIKIESFFNEAIPEPLVFCIKPNIERYEQEGSTLLVNQKPLINPHNNHIALINRPILPAQTDSKK